MPRLSWTSLLYLILITEKLLKAETDLLTALEEIDELKDALDEASLAESIVQELTDKNLALEEVWTNINILVSFQLISYCFNSLRALLN